MRRGASASPMEWLGDPAAWSRASTFAEASADMKAQRYGDLLGGLVEDVGGSFGAFVDFGGDGFDLEAGLLEAEGELFVGAGGPEDGGAAGLEHGLDGADSGF